MKAQGNWLPEGCAWGGKVGGVPPVVQRIEMDRSALLQEAAEVLWASITRNQSGVPSQKKTLKIHKKKTMHVIYTKT